jgi:hypothetical protein
MAQTPLQGRRQREMKAVADQHLPAAGPDGFSEKPLATDETLTLAPKPKKRTVGSRRNGRPRAVLDNGHAACANGREHRAATDQEAPSAAVESSAIAEPPGGEGETTSEVASASLQTHRTLEGQIDTVDWAAVNGWVWDPKTPGERIRLELVDGETALATAIASAHRSELVKRGIGDGGYGFSINFPDEIQAEGRHTLHLRCAESGAPVPGSPIVLDYTGLLETPGGLTDTPASPPSRTLPQSAAHVGLRILFDVSDLIYYIGEHANLTGIQRVQSSIVLAAS